MVISMVKISELVNPLILADKMVGFNGDSEFKDSNGELQMGSWTFVGILKDEDIDIVDEKYGIFELEDEITEVDIFIFGNDKLIPVWDAGHNFVCCVKIHYRRDDDALC